MHKTFRNLLLLGLLAELVVFILSYLKDPELSETFRYAARYSGRVSLVVFLYAFYLFSIPKQSVKKTNWHHWISVFALVHVIHFGFLATNIYLNAIELVPFKLVGGFLAYLMIVIAPFKLNKLKLKWQLVYFYYVSLVMIITYIARIKGDFEGAEPFWFHYFSLALLIVSILSFSFLKFNSHWRN